MSKVDNPTYQKLLQIRQSKTLKLAPNPYLKPELPLRYYQAQGVAHMYMVRRFVLGEDCGLGKCQVPETKIITKRGIINLLDDTLWYKGTIKKEDTFYNIPNDISLASDNISKATQIYYGGKKPTIYFKTRLGTWGQSTHNHGWKVMSKEGNIVWKKTSELEIGDYVAIGRNQNVWGYKKLDKDLAWLLGFIIGDGSYNIYHYKKKDISKEYSELAQLKITNTHLPTVNKIWDIIQKYFKNPKRNERPPRKKGYKLQYVLWESGNENVKEFMLKYGLKEGQTAEFKELPKILKGCCKETICKFLQGLFDADGHITKKGTIEITLATQDLIEDIQLFLLNMGIINTRIKKYNKKYKKYYYRITITDFLSKKKFYNWINFTVDYKKEELRKYVYKERKVNVTYDIIPYQQDRLIKIGKIIPKGLKWAFKYCLQGRNKTAGNLTYTTARQLLSFEHEEFFKNSKEYQELKEIFSFNYFFTPIKEIKDGGIQDVYDLSVPEGNTYSANGMISHNTIETIATYTALLNKDLSYKLMIVCPSSAMYQWSNEFKKFTKGVTTQIVEAGDIKLNDENGKRTLKSFDSREFLFNKFVSNNSNVLIFNYNTLCTDFLSYLKNLMSKYKFMVVFDEATAFKNIKSHTFKYALETSKLGDRVYALTATIIKNHLLEAFSIYQVVLPGLLGSQIRFKKNYCILEKIQLWKGKGKRGRVVSKIIGYKNLEYFKKAIDPYFLGRKKSQVAEELPKIVTKEISLRLSKEQQALYDDVLAGFLDFDKFKHTKPLTLICDDEDELLPPNEQIKYIDKLTALVYCQQICNSPYTINIEAPSAKEEEVLRILENELAGDKVVIYTRFKRMVNRLEKLITEQLKLPCTKITGDIDNKERENRKLLFNTSPDMNIMIINSAAKEAVNLQGSGYLVFYDLPFSYGDFLQIIGRIHRIGSTHDKIFLIYLMCKDTIDEKVYQILTSKKELFDAVLGDSAVGAIIPKNADMVNTLFEDMVKDAKSIKH